MSNIQHPKIIFPCNYPIKVITHKLNYEQQQQIILIFTTHDANHKLVIKHSTGSNYTSYRFNIVAISENQIKNIFSQIKPLTFVKMVL